jgi:lipopolysaccharide/colanic/teichoic acid biosynthesis glycosyltransferase
MIILPVLAVAIRLDSRGPVFYRQGRVGLDGRTFTIWKLRTMREEPEREPTLTRPNDPRITRVGRWLRRMHLDELPQFWNVLLGDMSLIGPRPEPPIEAEATTAIPLYPLRYAVRPGLVGWAAIHHPYVDSLDGARTRLEYDLYYIRHRSLWLDLQILVRASILWMAPKGR